MKSAWFFSVTIGMMILAMAEPSMANGDAQRGEALFERVCRACHTVEGRQNRVGPYLAGVWDRPVASADGYNYTKAMRSYGKKQGDWDETAMAAFLMNPRKEIKGTRMAYAGIRAPDAAADLVAYLKSLPSP